MIDEAEEINEGDESAINMVENYRYQNSGQANKKRPFAGCSNFSANPTFKKKKLNFM
jgi:hypothetical protein